ncbi:alpha/beta fold hydrolase [Altererythrobacter indicus]|uniref:Alpha/beta fold hydrolase n=1 Tax=Altericroceibacterium indicum TaxID=374177 RepID=A0A845A9G4_9SPHN|nr:alpha/beta hydrolase [Altericroceibacterium indicum]MXP26157.1 alpha/beta fold hydrolase [Altericroceibacterium indicum]
MILFLPGLICDSRIFAPQLEAFPDSHAVDGYGLADNFEDMARVALDQAPAEFDLFGHSMGARIALEVYRLAPERVRRLALVSTGVHPVKEGEPAKRARLQKLGHDQGFAALVDEWLSPMIAEPNRRNSAMVAELRQMCLEQGQEMFDAHVHALLSREGRHDLLPQITCPTLVMVGELDAWSSAEQHQAFAKAIPNAELVIVPGAGHMILHEAPEAVNHAIRNWLEMPASH